MSGKDTLWKCRKMVPFLNPYLAYAFRNSLTKLTDYPPSRIFSWLNPRRQKIPAFILAFTNHGIHFRDRPYEETVNTPDQQPELPSTAHPPPGQPPPTQIRELQQRGREARALHRRLLRVPPRPAGFDWGRRGPRAHRRGWVDAKSVFGFTLVRVETPILYTELFNFMVGSVLML